MKSYKGVVIEESIEDKSVLAYLRILSTEVEPVTEKNKTPWVKQWTMHTVEISAATYIEIVSMGSAMSRIEEKTFIPSIFLMR